GKPDVMFAASVNGGIWRTTNGGTDWEPLTDQLPSLSISTIAIAGEDADGKLVDQNTPLGKLVLYAGTGSFSSFSSRGGFTVGLFKSVDGGQTWVVAAPDQLSKVQIIA